MRDVSPKTRVETVHAISMTRIRSVEDKKLKLEKEFSKVVHTAKH